MQTHLKKHPEFVPFISEVCSKEIPFKNQFVIHSLIHRPKNLKCQICIEVFEQRADLIQHIRIHSSMFNCRICETAFVNSNLLESHICRFTKSKICKEQFSLKKGFTDRMSVKKFVNQEFID